MVVSNYFQDIYDVLSKTPTLSLPVLKQNPLKIDFASCDECKTIYNGSGPLLPFANSEVFQARISDWRRLTADDDGCKSVYEVTFDITGSNFTFKPGDTIGILPHNRSTEVDDIISHLDLNIEADLTYTLTADTSLKGGKIPPHVPVKSTLRHVLTHCLDLRSVMKKIFILALSKHTKDENERKVLEFLCSKEGSSTYNTHILEKKICLLDFFAIFKTCKPPIEVLLANLPRLLPRPYSIVNSQMKEDNILKICFSVMNLGNNRQGLTTSWLEEVILSNDFNLENGMKNLNITGNGTCCQYKVPIYLRKNMTGFLMPEDMKVPLLLIGPGTGVSPFIGFLEERELVANLPGTRLGDVWLYFGCRNPKLDFIYETELKGFEEKGVLSKLNTAFSRVQNHEIKYIQDALLRDGEEITKLINDGAEIFVCGDLKNMAHQIKDTLAKCLVKYGDMTLQDAEKFLDNLQKEKRYFVDVWS